MSADNLMYGLYLILFLGVVGGWFVHSNRGRWKSMLKHGTVWVFIFAVVIVGYGLWTDNRFPSLPRQSVFSEEGRVEVPRGFDGHYYVTLDINGVSVPFIIDTGASDVVLTLVDAARVGIAEDELMFTGRAQTANGRVETAQVRLDTVRLGTIEDRFVPAVVNSGAMRQSLLGMSYLGRFDKIEIAENLLILER